MDIRWIEDALVLLEEGNMTRAAARRNVTQPAFSRRIRGFEEWLGTRLLQRGTNSIEIGSALRANEAELRALLARLGDMRTKIKHFDPERATVTIAAQHAPVFSTFPDMALRAKRDVPGVRFRLRAGNLRDCLSLFLRGDARMLLCYDAGALSFGAGIHRALWGVDVLVPVVGGPLRYAVKSTGAIAEETPAVVYPDQSFFGEVLKRNNRIFGTQETCINAACETAFSSGIKELILKGIGVGWVPYSMVHREIESGALISLANHYGQEPLEIAIYAEGSDAAALSLLRVWDSKA